MHPQDAHGSCVAKGSGPREGRGHPEVLHLPQRCPQLGDVCKVDHAPLVGVATRHAREEDSVSMATLVHPPQGPRSPTGAGGVVGGEGVFGDPSPRPQTIGPRVIRVRRAALAVLGGGAMGAAVRHGLVHLGLVHRRISALEQLEQLLGGEPRGHVGDVEELGAGVVDGGEGGEEELEGGHVQGGGGA